MAIQPPSDIVLDVAKAADPVKLQAAAEKLARVAASGEAGTAPDFASVMAAARNGTSQASASATPPALSPAATLANLRTPGTHTARGAAGADTAQMKAYRGLEAVYLQTWVEAMMPRNEGFFGDAASGQICKSFLAQELANQLAKSGSIGLAKSLFAAHPPGGGSAAAEALAAGGATRRAQAMSTSAAAATAGTLTNLMAGSRPAGRRT